MVVEIEGLPPRHFFSIFCNFLPLFAARTVLLMTLLQPCFCTDIVDTQAKEGLSDDLAACIVGTLLEAGSDTTAATLVDLMQAMVLYP